ncbi:Uncharacterised protein [Mycobacteroides abscessus subsp. abscessus]|nr:Uncharacterised protein [Mycobacteroides abscessus subsp. abscessus]
MSLASLIASSVESTGYTDTTGPNVSLRKQVISSVTPDRTVGSKKKGPRSARRLPPATTVAPFDTASSTCASAVSTCAAEASDPMSTLKS